MFLVFLKDIKQSKYAGEIVWNNCNFLIQGKPVFNSTFYKTGIKYISDLFIKDTALASFNYWVDKGLPRSFIMTWYGLRSVCLELQHSISACSSGNGMSPKLLIYTNEYDTLEIVYFQSKTLLLDTYE